MGVLLEIVLKFLMLASIPTSPEQARRLCYVGGEAASKVAQASRLHTR